MEKFVLNEVMKEQVEIVLDGALVSFTSEEQCIKVITAALATITPKTKVDNILHIKERVEKAYNNAMTKYNRNNTPVTSFTIFMTECGLLVTFVRGKVPKSKKDFDLLCWVENMQYPVCSELGYCLFKREKNGMIYRVA